MHGLFGDNELKRDTYIDNIKILACFLVVAGHLLKSMVEAGCMQAGSVFEYGMEVLYSFHVNLFFMCSGYLYQKYSKIDSLKSYGQHLLKKIRTLLIPYVIFSTITLLLKYVAADSVNSKAGDYMHTILLDPVSPYWYLYALMIMFVIIPVMRGRWMASIMGVGSAIMMITYWQVIKDAPMPVYFFMNYSCWFILGMVMAYSRLEEYIEIETAVPTLILSGGLLGYILIEWYRSGMFFSYIRQVVSLLVCGMTMVIAVLISKYKKQSGIMRFMSKYTMPVFLMHTIFAAGTRMVLNKMHVTSLAIHLCMGLLAGIVGPVMVWMLKDKICNKEATNNDRCDKIKGNIKKGKV